MLGRHAKAAPEGRGKICRIAVPHRIGGQGYRRSLHKTLGIGVLIPLALIAAYLDGELVVDAWGGMADAQAGRLAMLDDVEFQRVKPPRCSWLKSARRWRSASSRRKWRPPPHALIQMRLYKVYAPRTGDIGGVFQHPTFSQAALPITRAAIKRRLIRLPPYTPPGRHVPEKDAAYPAWASVRGVQRAALKTIRCYTAGLGPA